MRPLILSLFLLAAPAFVQTAAFGQTATGDLGLVVEREAGSLLVVDRSAFDRIIQKGGYVSINAGTAPDGNAIPVGKEAADLAMDAAACIGCGACVAACPNASASLFTSAKITQLALLPQGQPERKRRVMAMVQQMDEEGFGDCSNHAECEAACPKGISITHIAHMRRDYFSAMVSG